MEIQKLEKMLIESMVKDNMYLQIENLKKYEQFKGKAAKRCSAEGEGKKLSRL